MMLANNLEVWKKLVGIDLLVYSKEIDVWVCEEWADKDLSCGQM